MTYTCPMHLKIEQNTPGACPKCGMKLVDKSAIKEKKSPRGYHSLAIVIGLISLTAFSSTFSSGFEYQKLISSFMIGFFLVFSGFKLLDLRGFAEGYATYDLLAQKWNTYGFIYPFVELFFAIAMIVQFLPHTILIAEVVVMLFSGIGVGIKLAKHEKFHCACLGTFLNVPLTKITLIEDFGMAILAIILLILH